MTALPMAPAAAPRPVAGALVQAVQPVELAMPEPAAPPPASVELSVPPAPLRSVAEPLTGELRRLHVTVSRRFTEKLKAAREALSHSHRGAEVEEILEAGLDLILERAAKRKALVARPRTKAPPPPPAGSPTSSRGSERPIPEGPLVRLQDVPRALMAVPHRVRGVQVVGVGCFAGVGYQAVAAAVGRGD